MIQVSVISLLSLTLLLRFSSAAPSAPEQIEFFEAKIRPLLAEKCFRCHSQEAKAKGKLKAGLFLDTVQGLLKGGDSGPAVSPGDPSTSRIVEAVNYRNEDMAMPPNGKLTDEQIENIKQWVSMGVPWPGADIKSIIANALKEEAYDWEKFRREHWSFRKIQRPDLPQVQNEAWLNSPIDRFVLAGLEGAKLKPNGPAPRRTLIRRAYLDLIGIPPTPDQVKEFLDDTSSEAFTKAINGLLNSEHYGERWARHWLDVARYSDGHGGFGDNKPLPQAWRYRDWVVSALNSDMPYDKFIIKQIAGDLIKDDPDPIPTGFFVVGPTYQSDGGDPEAKAQAQAETLSDRVDTFSRAFLGLTAACARCHNHKFDPITTQDYYSLAGIFNNTKKADKPIAAKHEIDAYNSWQKAVNEINNTINSFLDSESKRLQVDRKQIEKSLPEESKSKVSKLRNEVDQLKKQAPPKPANAHVLVESGNADMHVALRGDLRKKGEKVPRRFIEIIAGKDSEPYTEGSGRLGLAKSVTDPKNPLTARVMVNRVWGWHFGNALVTTPSNFGVIGQRPSHPELLDWLAIEFMANGWSLKELHRKILLSSTWQMSSDFNQHKFNVDGDNKLLWRMNPRKLEVEAWRDSLLAVTGELDGKVGGPPAGEILNSKRRTLYATISRTGDRFQSDVFLRLFDFPAAVSTSAKRTTSVVPQQYLFMMNSPFMTARAQELGKRFHEFSGQASTTIVKAYEQLYSRLPDESELKLANAWLGESPSQRNWEQYAQVLLSAHELIQVR